MACVLGSFETQPTTWGFSADLGKQFSQCARIFMTLQQIPDVFIQDEITFLSECANATDDDTLVQIFKKYEHRLSDDVVVWLFKKVSAVFSRKDPDRCRQVAFILVRDVLGKGGQSMRAVLEKVLFLLLTVSVDEQPAAAVAL